MESLFALETFSAGGVKSNDRTIHIGFEIDLAVQFDTRTVSVRNDGLVKTNALRVHVQSSQQNRETHNNQGPNNFPDTYTSSQWENLLVFLL